MLWPTPQSGIDLNTYPTNFNKYYLIAYGILGETMDLDPNKTYDYHTAFDIKPTEVVYNVDLDMNRKKILNIVLDKTKNNSAVTVKMVKDLETKLSPHTTNNVYREIFEEFYDLSDAGIYKLQTRPSGVVFIGLLPNIYFTSMFIANVEKGGLRIQNKPIQCFHMTSRRPYWCPKTMKRRPCWCPKPILWEFNSFLMQTLSFVPINLHRCWPRE